MSPPIDWINHFQEPCGQGMFDDFCVPERGSNMFKSGPHGEVNMKQLHAAHMLGNNFQYFDSAVDYKEKSWPFLEHVTPYLRKKWLKEITEEAKATPHQEGGIEWCFFDIPWTWHGLVLGLRSIL